MLEASFSGTFRTILVLVAVWWLLRYLMRRHAMNGTTTRASAPRDRGHVTVERASSDTRGRSGEGPVIIDADFEEIK